MTRPTAGTVRSGDRRARAPWYIAVALLAAACGGGTDGSAAGVAPTPAAPPAHQGSDDTPATHDEHDADSTPATEEMDGAHDMDGTHDMQDMEAAEATDTSGRPTTTDATLAALAAMDPSRLAGLHDHDDEHHEAPARPRGIDPHRLVVPAIGVDTDIIDLGLQPDGSMEVPTDFAQAGWFSQGPQPGRVGPAVIAGHVDSTSGPAVFYRLTDLEVGDEIEVHADDGEVVTFEVTGREQHPKDAFPTDRVYAGTPGPELRLITCGGTFDRGRGSYRDNVIVYAERTDVA